METAILGGGCFWCLEAVFEQVDGVDSVVSGYSGGSVPNPSYAAVCEGNTGHAEVVRIVFEPAVISFKELLRIFFAIHDPTSLNRQGNDVGTQYRSVIFYTTSKQQQDAQAVIRQLEAERIWEGGIVTQVLPAQEFFPAESYHQEYFRRNSDQGYCAVVVGPKVAKFRSRFTEKLKGQYR